MIIFMVKLLICKGGLGKVNANAINVPIAKDGGRSKYAAKNKNGSRSKKTDTAVYLVKTKVWG